MGNTFSFHQPSNIDLVPTLAASSQLLYLSISSVFSLSGQNDAPPSSTTPPFCFLPIRKILHQQTIHNTILPRNISKHGHQDFLRRYLGGPSYGCIRKADLKGC